MTRYTLSDVLLILAIILATVAIDTVWKINLEDGARLQAKYNLNQIKSCVNTLLLSDDDGLLTNYSNKSKVDINRALFVCAKNMRVSPQGDVWAYDLKTKEYVFDSNAKYGEIKNRYWRKDKVCGKKGDWCGRLIAIMDSGYDSTWMGYSWLFKHDKEYLEWKVLPQEELGFNGVSKSGNGGTQQIIVVQGAREQELLKRYSLFRRTTYGIGFVLILLVLVIKRRFEHA